MLKRFISFVTAATLLFSAFDVSVTAFADTENETFTDPVDEPINISYDQSLTAARSVESGDIGVNGANVSYTFDTDTGEVVISGTGNMVDYVSTGFQNPNPSPFCNNENVKSVIIESGVANIGNHLFYGCKNLETVQLTDSITNIGGWAFQKCEKITSFTIPNRVTRIGGWAFAECAGLRDIAIPDSVVTIDRYAFTKCNSLTQITIPETVKLKYDSSIGETNGAIFYECKGLKEVTLYNDRITPSMFYMCSALETVNILGEVTIIDSGAFTGCVQLKNIDIPKSVVKIGNDAFRGCASIDEIIIPNGVTEIDWRTFSGCRSLKTITIPESVTSFSNDNFHALSGCDNLETVFYPDGLYISHDEIPNATMLQYETENGGMNITSIVLGDGKTKVELHDTEGGIPVLSVAEIFRDRDVVLESGHTHVNETEATCTSKAVCKICGEYGEFTEHNFENDVCTLCGMIAFTFSYDYGDMKISIGNYIGNNTDVIIPEEVVLPNGQGIGTTVKITSDFGSGDNEKRITKLTLPRTIESIECDFTDMTSLKEIVFSGLDHPISINNTGDKIFPDCLEKITFPAGKTCSDVNDAIGLNIIPDGVALYSGTEPLQHSMLISHAAVPAGCTTNGNEAYWTCSICNKMFSDENGKTEIDEIPVIPAGHNWDDGEVITEPTETDEGVKMFTCTKCGETRTETIPKKDPIVTEPPVTEPPVTNPSDTEPPVTVPPVTAPTETYPSITAPYSGYPLVIPYGYTTISNEKMFEALAGASDGDTVVIDLNGNTKVDRSVFDEIKGRDVTVQFRLKNGAYWTINGKDIEKSRKVDLGVRMNRASASRDEIKELAGDKKTVKFTLRHDGALGFNGILNVPINEKYNGKYANLYYYNNGFEFVCSSLISDGYARFSLYHASEYIIVIDDYPHGEDVSAAAGAYSSDETADGSSRTATASENNPMYFINEKKFKLPNRKRRYRIVIIER